MKTKISLLLITLIALLANLAYCQSPKDQTASLQLNLPKGFQAAVRIIEAENTSLTKEDRIILKEQRKTVYDYQIYCHNVSPDGTMEIWQTQKKVCIQGHDTNGTFEYDSSIPETDTPSRFASQAALVNNTIIKHITPDGTITKVQGIEKIIDDTLALSQFDPAKIPDRKKKFLDEFSAPQKWPLTAALTSYPDKSIHQSDTWDGPPAPDTANTFTVESVNENLGIAIIQQHFDQHLDKKISENQTFVSDMQTTSKSYVDLATGLVLFSESSRQLHGKTPTGATQSTSSSSILRLISQDKTE